MWSTKTDEKFATKSQKQVCGSEERLSNPEEKTVETQFSSYAQAWTTLCDPMNSSTPGLPVHHQLPGFTQKLPSLKNRNKEWGAVSRASDEGNRQEAQHTHCGTPGRSSGRRQGASPGFSTLTVGTPGRSAGRRQEGYTWFFHRGQAGKKRVSEKFSLQRNQKGGLHQN